MQKRVFPAVLSVLIVLAASVSVLAAGYVHHPLDKARELANKELEEKTSYKDYFPETITLEAKDIYKHPYDASKNDTVNKPGTALSLNPDAWARNVLVYGKPWDYDKPSGYNRYLGYARSKEPVTNVLHPFDTAVRDLDDYCWVERPWSFKVVEQKYKIKYNSFDEMSYSDPSLFRASMIKGLEYTDPDVFNENGRLAQNLHKYVHIILPPTYYSWGCGIMFNTGRLDNNPDDPKNPKATRLFYKTVPMAPGFLADPDFYVKELSANTEEIEPGERYEGKVIFGLREGVQAQNAVIELTHCGTPITSIHKKTMKFEPGQEIEFEFEFTGQDAESVLVAKIRPAESSKDANWDDNAKELIIPLTGMEQEIPEGDPHLKLTVITQDGQVIRPENTAKWTDRITADFTAPSAPHLGSCYRLKKWELQKAEITYPKKHPMFTFGNPLPPVGTITLPMAVNKENNTATITFKEDWSMNGAPIYNYVLKKQIPGPTLYPITVKYEILWEYEKGRKEYYTTSDGKRKSRCVDWKSYSKTRTGSVTVKLLVNGTAVDSRSE